MAAPNSYSTTQLVSNVQLIAHIPLSNATFTSSQIITLADRELQTALISQIVAVREGYYLSYVDYDPSSDGTYAVPSQAIAGAIANIQLVLSPGLVPINRIEQAEQFSTTAPTATSYGYFIQNNTIQVLPVPTQGSIRVWFPRRPNALTATSAAGSISAIASNVITVSSLPTSFAVGTVVNLCQDQPQFDVLASREITGISGTDVTLDSAVDDLAEFDWLCLENQTPVPQIPVEFRPLLEQRVTVKIYELQGYLDKMKMAKDELKEMEQALYKLILPRNSSQTKIVNPQNGGFINNAGRFASLYWSSGR